MTFKTFVYRTLIAVLAVMVSGIFLAPMAQAQCGYMPGVKLGSANFQPLSRPAPSTAGKLLLVSDDDQEISIVGFWKVSLVAEGNHPGPPDGTPIDFGFQQWHSDGTEILNSGARAPATGDFCLGVWKSTGHRTYSLNHFAVSYDPAGNLIGPATVREEVVLDRDGNSYHGTFQIVQYDMKGNQLGGVQGAVSGTRITVDTKP